MQHTTAGTIDERPATRPSAARRLRDIAGNRELALLPAIAATMILGAILSPNFLTVNNLVNNVLVVSAVLGMVVLAETVILIAGHFDLSLESTVGLAPMIAVWLVLPVSAGGSGWGWPSWLAIVALFAVGAAVGAFNGLVVAHLRLNAFMVTLAMLILMRGLTVGVAGGETLSGVPETFRYLGSAKPLGVSIQVWIFLITFIIAAYFMRNHPTGRRIYALGGNPEAAAAAGIRTKRLTVGVFVLGSVIAAFAGLMLTGRIASVASNQGDGMIFTVFAAAVIGGISLDGGRGSIAGAFSGVILLGLIQNLLVLSSVPSYWIDAVYGLIILSALVVNHFVGLRTSQGVAS